LSYGSALFEIALENSRPTSDADWKLVAQVAAIPSSDAPRWKQFFASLESDCQFGPPASESQLVAVEQALGCGRRDGSAPIGNAVKDFHSGNDELF
jgi:hypothetical protein